MKNNQDAYTLDFVLFPNDKMKEFNDFSKQYANTPDKYLFREIIRVKNDVSQELLATHIKNLDALAKMDGFVTDAHRQRIDMVKKLLTSDTLGTLPKSSKESSVEKEFFAGSSLLLWFLALAAIWRRPFFRRPF